MINYSVIIPMYNAAEYIGRTIESIISDKERSIEVILVDDGSTDNSSDAASGALSKAGDNISYRIIRQANSGVSAARNAGLAEATGKYVIFCDSDDEFCPGLFEALELHISEDHDFLTWPFYNEQNNALTESQPLNELNDCLFTRDKYLSKHLLGGYKLRLGAFAVKSNLLSEYDIRFDENCTFGEDVEFFMKALLCVKNVYMLNRPYYIYHKHEGSLAYSYNIRRFEAPRAIERVYKWYAAKISYVNSDDDSSNNHNLRIAPLNQVIDEYIQNGLYILHSIYALNSCCAHVNGLRAISELYSKFKIDYKDVYEGIKIRMRTFKTSPYLISKLRIRILKISIKLYMLYISICLTK